VGYEDFPRENFSRYFGASRNFGTWGSAPAGRFPMQRAAEAYERMMSGQARFRVFLVL